MDDAAAEALYGSIGGYEVGSWRRAYDAAMLAASPGNDLLQRIVRALHLGSTNLRNDGFINASDGIDLILTELGAIAAAQPFTET